MGDKKEQEENREEKLKSWAAIALITVTGLVLIITGMRFLYNRMARPQLPAAIYSTTAAGLSDSENAADEQQRTAAENEMLQATASQIQESETETESGSVGLSKDTADESNKSEKEASSMEDSEIKAEVRETAAPAGSLNVVDIDSIEPTYVRLVMVGDNLLHRSIALSGLKDDGSYNYDYNFVYIKDAVQSADLAIINQECVIGGNELGIQDFPCFNARTEVADAIVNAGFDVVLAANNHILDMGASGALYMINYFKQNYPQVTLLGIHDGWETRNDINIIECNGIRIGMINYTQVLNCTADYYADGQYLVDMLDYDRLTELIRYTREDSDFVIVFPHWGTEYNLSTDEAQAEQVQFLAEQGVDLVIGTHPHVVEPVKYVDRPDGGKMLVYYSLGNYQSAQSIEETVIGGMADVIIEKGYRTASIIDFNMEFLATDYRFSHTKIIDYYDVVTTYPWSMYSKEFASTGDLGNVKYEFSIDRMFELEAQMAAQVYEERQKAGLVE